jgi:hypothetical protein
MMDNNPDFNQMEDFMNKQLEQADGTFCVENLAFPGCRWGLTTFRKFLKSNVRNGTLSAERDEFGRVWYKKRESDFNSPLSGENRSLIDTNRP